MPALKHFMSTTTTISSGSSRYSSDFQSVIDRAVAIASLPLNQLTSDQTKLSSQSTDLSTLDSDFAALQTAEQNIESALGSTSLKSTISQTGVGNVTLSDGAMLGDYTLEVKKLGVYATSMSQANWAGGSTPVTYQLKLGSDGTPIDITAASNDATAVAAQINKVAGDQVRATVINIGGSANPDNRIVLTSVKLGTNLTPQLLQGATDMQAEQYPGEYAEYTVGGSSTTVQSDTRSVSIAPGITVDLLGTNEGSPATISVAQQPSTVSTALQAFATAYNAAVDALNKQRGSSGGSLTGDSVVQLLTNNLRSMATYQDAYSGVGLASIGLDLDKTGHLTFNSTNYAKADQSAIASFLGSASSGSGFLKLANDTLNEVEDPTTGTLKTAEASNATQSLQLQQSISDQQDRVDALKTQLQSQMAAADALISSMEQQYNYISGMFESMQTASAQYQ